MNISGNHCAAQYMFVNYKQKLNQHYSHTPKDTTTFDSARFNQNK